MILPTTPGRYVGGTQHQMCPENSTLMTRKISQAKATCNNLTLQSSGIGEYMIEWMSKDGGASADATGSNREGCQQAGICNPVITFIRQGYNLELYTYESLYQGNDYGTGPPGLCQGGDVNQFHKGGASFSYK
jgi:hypothetical protein